MRGHRRHCEEEDPARTGVAATVQVRVLVFNNAISCGASSVGSESGSSETVADGRGHVRLRMRPVRTPNSPLVHEAEHGNL